MSTVSLLPVEGLPEVEPGDDLSALIATRFSFLAGDVLVVAQKVVSKAEGRIRHLAGVSPEIERSVVDLPAPLEPMIVTTSPSSTLTDTPRSASIAP